LGKLRTERDKTLAVPQLLIQSIQVNMRAGEMPPPEDNGVSYIKPSPATGSGCAARGCKVPVSMRHCARPQIAFDER
jgi:hypothetical protein